MTMISVIMPVYNSVKYLSESIESVLNQTFSDFEFIIVNDGSTDSTKDILEKYSRLDARISIIEQQNMGIVASLNNAICRAKGQYIARMDSDDISHRNRLQLQFQYIDENKLDVIGSHYYEIDENGELLGLRLVPILMEIIDICLFTSVPFAHPSVMIRRKFLEDHHIQYGKDGYHFAEDLALWMKMHELGAKFGNLNEIVFSYRVLNNSLSRTKRRNIFSDSISLYHQYCLKNRTHIENILEKRLTNLQSKNNKWLCAALVKYFIRFGKLKYLREIKKYPKKLVVECLFSELNRTFKI